MLQRLADECDNALEWSHDAEVVAVSATEAFQSIALVCEQAGLIVAENPLDSPTGDPRSGEAVKPRESLSVELPSPRFSDAVRQADPMSPRSATFASSEKWSLPELSCVLNHQQLDDSRCTPSPLRREEIIEIELTDLLTHTHEEIQNCRREFSRQVQASAAKHEESRWQTRNDIETLETAVENAQDAMTRIQQEVFDTKQSMEALQVAVLQAQKSTEAAMKEQSQHWKSICNDLIVEKRNVAKKLAEERGKYASLKEHLAMHDSHVDIDARVGPRCAQHTVASTLQSPMLSATDILDKTASYTDSSLNMASNSPASKTDSCPDDHYSGEEGESRFKSSYACRSLPSSSASTRRSSKCKLTPSDLSSSHPSSPSATLQPHKAGAPTSNTFRRYYLSTSSKQLSSSTSSPNMNSASSKRSCSS